MVKGRIIALIDMDCFYAQVEQRLQPHLFGKPVAVVQHSTTNPRGGLLLAVSYEARPFGIKRGMFAEHAKTLCPELTLCYVPVGEHIDKADITRYRDASAEVFKVLHEFDSRIIVERASVDEAYMDLTALVEHFFEIMNPTSKYAEPSSLELFPTTHVADGTDVNDEKNANWKYDRIESLRSFISKACETKDEHKLKLIIGTDLIEQIRSKIKEDTMFNCSAGIGSSKMIAKLVCSRHKPGQQTVVSDDAIPAVFRYTPISEVRNLGGKLGKSLMEKFDIKTMGELSRIPMSDLAEYFPAQATWIHNIARGIDEEKVTARDKQSSVAVSKNFPGSNALKTESDVKFWLEGLVKELIKRLADDQIKNNRTASTLHIGCTMDSHFTRSIQIKTYDPKGLFTSVWALFRELNKSSTADIWNPSVKNITLSADRFRDGMDARSKQITEWVMTTMRKVMNATTVDELPTSSNTASIEPEMRNSEADAPLQAPGKSSSLRSKEPSQQQHQQQDDDVQIIAEKAKKKTATKTANRLKPPPPAAGKKRKKKAPPIKNSPKKKISDFFKKI